MRPVASPSASSLAFSLPPASSSFLAEYVPLLLSTWARRIGRDREKRGFGWLTFKLSSCFLAARQLELALWPGQPRLFQRLPPLQQVDDQNRAAGPLADPLRPTPDRTADQLAAAPLVPAGSVTLHAQDVRSLGPLLLPASPSFVPPPSRALLGCELERTRLIEKLILSRQGGEGGAGPYRRSTAAQCLTDWCAWLTTTLRKPQTISLLVETRSHDPSYLDDPPLS